MRQLRDFIPELFVQFNVFSLHDADLTEVQCCQVCAGRRSCGRYTWRSLIREDKKSKSRSFPTPTSGQQLLPSAIFEAPAPAKTGNTVSNK